MILRYFKIFLSVFFLLSFLFAFCSMCFADEIPAGKIIKLKGLVQVVRAGGQTAEPASAEMGLNIGDTILTGPDGSASILLSDESMIQLNKNTNFVLKEVEQKAGWLKMRKIAAKLKGNPSVYQLNKGEAWIRNKDKDASFEVKTPTSVAGVRGTDLNLKVEQDGTSTLTVMEGLVLAKNEFGSVDVNAGEQAVAKPGQAPRKVVLVTPEDAVQWTVTIPPIIETKQIVDASALNAYNKLMNGEIKEAQGLLLEITSKDPNLSIAWSLLSLSEILTGKPAKALESAKKGVEAARDSSLAYVIQSYAYQANFDLDGAQASTKKALQIDDKNAYALIAHARLLFSSDYTDEALSFISKARQLAPNDPEIDTLYGFILLAQRKSEGALSAFKQALQNDPGSGEAHMGLSLVYMRKGDTATAMEEISKAVLLEPRRSLFLSYWAKMLYQLRRFDQALDILKFARQIDPNDPTPELYSAIIYRDLNQPTEAIEAINKAVALNDKKAVYRSRFLLDKDLAVKNIDLSILYNQLGLDAWAQNKALASVKQDYTNYSGHLFLGGALSRLEGRSLAAGGEFLLARLLQPANLNTFNTFNNYTSFFDKPDIAGTITGAIGNHDTHSGDIYTYGSLPKIDLAFNLQGIYSDTNGWRDTNKERKAYVAGIMKWDMTPKDNFMLAVLHNELKQTDKLFPRYEFDIQADPLNWLNNKQTRYEMGYHHNFSPNADLLLFFSRLKTDERRLEHTKFPVNLTSSFELYKNAFVQKPYYQTQEQQIFKIWHHQLILGAVQYWGDSDDNIDSQLFLNNNGNLSLMASAHINYNMNRQFFSYYAQDIWKILPRLTLEGALYFDRIDNTKAEAGTEWTIEKINPRIGLVWTPTNSDTFRIAAFQVLVPFASSRLDPMDIGGVTVLRNTQEGSVAKEFDIMWEHEWSTGFLSTDFFNVRKEFFFKDMLINGLTPVTTHGRFDGVEIALNQLLWRGYGLAAGYRYLDADDKSLSIAERQEHLATIGLKHLSKSGFSCGIFETYRFLDLKFPGRSNEDIWITDAQIGYEFPKKIGSFTLEFRNIFNSRFNWITDQFIFTGRAPAREITAKLSMNF